MNSEIVYSYSKPIILSEESLIALVDDVVNEISIHAPLTIEGVCSMTISIHGIVYNNKIVFALDYDVINETTLNDLTHRYSFPIHFSNEANMSALAEYSYIYNNSPNSIVSLNIHEKVNTGVICHNKILHGSRGFSGEYGHNILYPNGKKCECGNKGCVEAYCSEKALLEEYCIAKNIDSASLKMLSSDFYIKDPTSEKILQGFCFNIAIVINNIATSIDPDLIILNGPIFDEFPTIFSVIEEELNQILSSEINMKKSTLKDNSVLKGGIINSIMCYLNIANFYFD
jgi:predicted NBD/HSP70 family sugar kinase